MSLSTTSTGLFRAAFVKKGEYEKAVCPIKGTTYMRPVAVAAAEHIEKHIAILAACYEALKKHHHVIPKEIEFFDIHTTPAFIQQILNQIKLERKELNEVAEKRRESDTNIGAGRNMTMVDLDPMYVDFDEVFGYDLDLLADRIRAHQPVFAETRQSIRSGRVMFVEDYENCEEVDWMDPLNTGEFGPTNDGSDPMNEDMDLSMDDMLGLQSDPYEDYDEDSDIFGDGFIV